MRGRPVTEGRDQRRLDSTVSSPLRSQPCACTTAPFSDFLRDRTDVWTDVNRAIYRFPRQPMPVPGTGSTTSVMGAYNGRSTTEANDGVRAEINNGCPCGRQRRPPSAPSHRRSTLASRGFARMCSSTDHACSILAISGSVERWPGAAVREVVWRSPVDGCGQ